MNANFFTGLSGIEIYDPETAGFADPRQPGFRPVGIERAAGAVPLYEPVTNDCSMWNCLNIQDHPEDTGIDYALAASRSKRIIIRMSIGNKADPRGQQIYAGFLPYAEAGQIELLAYHTFIESIAVSTQVSVFQALCVGKKLAGIMGDFEVNSSGLSPAALAAKYLAFAPAIEAALGFPPYSLIMYSAEWFWGPNIGQVSASSFAKYRAIFAQYTLDFDNLLIPYPWRNGNWWKHQYSADGNGMGAYFGFPSHSLDINRDNPEGDPEPEPPAAEFGPAFQARVTDQVNPWLNVRAKPQTGGQDVGDLPKGRIVEVYDEIIDGAGNTWWLVVDQVQGGLGGWAAAEYQGKTFLEKID